MRDHEFKGLQRGFLNTDLVKLEKSGGKPILLGFCYWTAVEKKTLKIG